VKIVKSTRHKSCSDGSTLNVFILDRPVDRDFTDYLKNFGTVRIKELKETFFSFDKEYFPSIKGLLGDDTVEVRYKKGFSDLTSEYFHLLLYYYHDGKGEVEKFRRIEETIMKKMEVRIRE